MKVVITNEAWQRLEKELTFLIETRQIPENKALSIGKKLIKRAKSLSNQPYIGQQEPYLTELNQNHKRLIKGDFKILYLIEGEVIYITNFFNTHRNPNSMKG